jgi:hypothetical protein
VDRGRWDSEGVSRAAGLRPGQRAVVGVPSRGPEDQARVDDRALDRAAVEFSGPRAEVGSELGSTSCRPAITSAISDRSWFTPVFLPKRHEDLEGLPSWLEHQLADRPPQHANLIRPFLHWFLLRRARNRAAVRRYPASANSDLRRRVILGLELLAWLDERRLPWRNSPRTTSTPGSLPATASLPRPPPPELDVGQRTHPQAHRPYPPAPTAGRLARGAGPAGPPASVPDRRRRCRPTSGPPAL